MVLKFSLVLAKLKKKFLSYYFEILQSILFQNRNYLVQLYIQFKYHLNDSEHNMLESAEVAQECNSLNSI